MTVIPRTASVERSENTDRIIKKVRHLDVIDALVHLGENNPHEGPKYLLLGRSYDTEFRELFHEILYMERTNHVHERVWDSDGCQYSFQTWNGTRYEPVFAMRGPPDRDRKVFTRTGGYFPDRNDYESKLRFAKRVLNGNRSS